MSGHDQSKNIKVSNSSEFPFSIPPYRNVLPPCPKHSLPNIAKAVCGACATLAGLFTGFWEWSIVGWAVAILWGVGFLMIGLAFTPMGLKALKLADVFFLVGTALLAVALFRNLRGGKKLRLIAGFTIFLILTMPELLLVRWVRGYVTRSVSIPQAGSPAQTPRVTTESEIKPVPEKRPAQVPPVKTIKPPNLSLQKPKRTIEASPSKVPPTQVSPRIGAGPDAYEGRSDAEVGQLGIDEAENIKKMASSYIRRFQDFKEPNPLIFIFSKDFKDCCAQGLRGLRAEILRRLGPPGDNPEEKKHWESVFMDDRLEKEWPSNVPLPTQLTEIWPMSVIAYAPYLRELGIKLKRRAIPFAPPLRLHFLVQTLPLLDPKFAVTTVATIQPQSTISRGYILIEFIGEWATMGSDLKDITPIITGGDVEESENIPLIHYMTTLKSGSFYALKIGALPITPDSPLHFVVSGAKPVTITKVIWFDD